MIESEMITRLRSELEPIYQQVAPFDFSRYASPWLESVCRQWSETALPVAQEILHDTDLVIVRSCPNPARTTFALPFNFTPVHYYILDRSTADPLCIDGTYLQFSSWTHARESQDHVLIENASHTQDILGQIGVAAAWQYQWRPDIYRKHVFSTFPDNQPLKINTN